MAKYPPAVERWRPLVEKYFPPELVDKALFVIQGESGGDPKAFGGGATGLFQIQALPGRPAAKTFEDPETNVRYAAQTLGAARNKWSDWGEGTEGQAPYDPKTGKGRFGALGNHPYQGGAVNGRAGTDTTFGGGSMPPAQTKPTGGILGAAGKGLAAGAHAVDPAIAAASSRMDDIVAQFQDNMPRKTDPAYQVPQADGTTAFDAIVFQKAFGAWALALKNYEAAQKSLSQMTRGVIQVGDQVVPMEDAPPEIVAAAKAANLDAYHKALNQLGLDEFKIGAQSRNDSNNAITGDFQNKTAAFGNSRDFDTLNLTKSKQELDRWMQGQQTAAGDQSAIQAAQTQIGKYGTTNGKTAFSGKDLGAGFAAFANAFGMGDAPLIQYPGTQTFNPVKDRLDSLAGMGIDNVAPGPGALHTTADMLPQPGQLDTSVQPVPQFLDPVDPTTGLPGGAGPAGTGHMLPLGVTAGAGTVDPSLLGYAHGTRHAPQHLDIAALLAHHKAQVLAQMHGGGMSQQPGGMMAQPLPAPQPQMPPGMPGQGIPRFAGGTGPADVGTAVTGTQIPLDAAQANATIMGPVLTQRGQDLTYQVALMNAQQAAQQAQRQYYVDLATIGQNAADLNFRQRQADVQQQMQYAQQLQQAQSGRVDARFKALDLLASRSGPQDWVAYNYLLNQMGAPTGKLVDPTKFADEIKDPEKPAGLGSINQQYTPDTSKMTAPSGTLTVPDKPAPINMNGGGAAPNQPPGGGQTTANPAGINPNLNSTLTKPAYTSGGGSQVWNSATQRWEDKAGNPIGGGASAGAGAATAKSANAGAGNSITNGVETNAQGQPWNEQYQGWDDKQGHYYKNGGWTNPDGSPYQAMVSGGATHAGQFITGDKPGSLGDDSEMIVNPTNAPIQVLRHSDLMALLQRHKAAVMPHFAGGTGWDNSLGSTAGMDVGWGTPSIKAPMNPPSGAGDGGALDSGWTGSEGGYASQPKPQPAQQQPMLNPGAWQQGPDGGGIHAQNPEAGMTFGGGGMQTQPIYTQPIGQPPLTTQPINAQPIGGAPAGGSTVLNPDGSYGMPTTPGYRVYDPKVLGNQPFYQKLLGNMGHPDFQGFGAPLSNASLGIQNAPWNINYQNYLGLNASEKDQTQGLYNQGLGVDFRDILAQAKAAYAPMLAGRASRYLNPAYGA